ncbi:hypothetical protein MRX96_054562 [Rhipicephalus microplus]
MSAAPCLLDVLDGYGEKSKTTPTGGRQTSQRPRRAKRACVRVARSIKKAPHPSRLAPSCVPLSLNLADSLADAPLSRARCRLGDAADVSVSPGPTRVISSCGRPRRSHPSTLLRSQLTGLRDAVTTVRGAGVPRGTRGAADHPPCWAVLACFPRRQRVGGSLRAFPPSLSFERASASSLFVSLFLALSAGSLPPPLRASPRFPLQRWRS